jgi:hypothetical protein
MAIDLSTLFGQQQDYSQILSPAEQQRIQSNAGQQALLNSAIALLAQSGRTREPISTGQLFGSALGAGMEGYNQAFDRTLKQMVTGMQLEDFKRKRQAQEMARGAITQTPVPIPMATGKDSQLQMLQNQTADFGTEGANITANALMSNPNLPTRTSVNLDKLIAAAAFESPLEAAKMLSKEDKTPASVQEYEYAVRNGFKGSFTDYLAKKTPGTNVTVKTGEGVAAQVGGMLKDANIQAQGANIQIDAADRVIGAVDTGKIIAGTFATPQLRLAQFGQVLGVTGKDTAETIANTRQAIRGFAELTLQGRKSMRGEGAITESEGKLAEKAFSGDIDSLTPAEIRQIANASKRVAEYSISEYNRKLDIIGRNPDLKDVVEIYRVNPIQPMKQGNIKRFNPATGKVE